MTNEELSLKTKQSLAQALKNTMEHKKLSKITISELCAVCRINRKTCRIFCIFIRLQFLQS